MCSEMIKTQNQSAFTATCLHGTQARRHFDNSQLFMQTVSLICSHLVSINVIAVRAARCSPVVRAFAHGTMGRRINHSWGGPIEPFLVPSSAPRLV